MTDLRASIYESTAKLNKYILINYNFETIILNLVYVVKTFQKS